MKSAAKVIKIWQIANIYANISSVYFFFRCTQYL